MEEDDEYQSLRGILEERCPDTKFEAGDVKKLVDVGLKTESRLAEVNKEILSLVLPARDAVVNAIFQAIGHPPGTPRRLAWLKQKLPPLVYGSSHASSSRSETYSHWPDSTKLWDLSRDVDEYLADAATKDSYHDSIHMEVVVRTRLRNDADSKFVYHSLLMKVGSALLGESFEVQSGVLFRSLSSSNQQRGEAAIAAVANAIHLASDYYVDMTLQLRSRNFLLVEMKRPSFFRETPRGPIPDLVVAYGHRHDTCSDGNRYPVLAQVVNQLFTYMFTGRVSYGIISSADLSYFVWAGSDALHISKGVEWQDEKFVAVLSYFLEKAAKDSTEFSGKEGHESSQDNECTSEGSDDDPMSDHKDDNLKGPPNLKKRPASVLTRSKGKGASGGKRTTVLKEMPAGRLHLESHPYATGWSGNVVRGMYKGVAIAVKLASVGTDRAETLVNEASAYLKLRDCWGTYVPALISYGTTANGRVVYVATELIVGSELEMGNLTALVVKSSFEALQVIHSFGVLHGDVRRQNILVPFSGEQGVRFIDFGFSRAIATEKDCRKELQELQGVVRELRRGT